MRKSNSFLISTVIWVCIFLADLLAGHFAQPKEVAYLEPAAVIAAQETGLT